MGSNNNLKKVKCHSKISILSRVKNLIALKGQPGKKVIWASFIRHAEQQVPTTLESL